MTAERSLNMMPKASKRAADVAHILQTDITEKKALVSDNIAKLNHRITACVESKFKDDKLMLLTECADLVHDIDEVCEEIKGKAKKTTKALANSVAASSHEGD